MEEMKGGKMVDGLEKKMVFYWVGLKGISQAVRLELQKVQYLAA